MKRVQLSVESSSIRSAEGVILALATRGDAAALTVLYEEHGGMLLRLATRLMRSADDAEDILHDLFVALPEMLARYENRGALGPWLRGVVTQMSLGRLRLRRRRDSIAAARDSEPAPENDLWSTMDLERAIAALPDELRTVFVLRFLEEMSHEDIAAYLGISIAASRTRHHRALRKLRTLLEHS